MTLCWRVLTNRTIFYRSNAVYLRYTDGFSHGNWQNWREFVQYLCNLLIKNIYYLCVLMDRCIFVLSWRGGGVEILRYSCDNCRAMSRYVSLFLEEDVPICHQSLALHRRGEKGWIFSRSMGKWRNIRIRIGWPHGEILLRRQKIDVTGKTVSSGPCYVVTSVTSSV